MDTPAHTDATPADDTSASRRRALLGLAGLATTGATALVVGSSGPAGAGGHGQALTMGDGANTASATTGIAVTTGTAPAFSVQNDNGDCAVRAGGRRGSGFTGTAGAVIGDGEDGDGVVGYSGRASGVRGRSRDGYGVLGVSSLSSGVVGETSVGAGSAVAGWHKGSYGVGVFGQGVGDGHQGAGVMAFNATGNALVGDGKVQLRLVPADVPGIPTRVAHAAGQVHVDSLGVMRACVGFGRWRTVAAPTSAGSFHVLPAPVRAYDSRPGTVPAAGPKVKLAAGQARTIDLKVDGTGVPAGATAALLTVLVVNAPKANGNLTVWSAGVARPHANTLVWGGDAGRFTTQAATAVDASAQVQVLASHATDIVIDVVGYYA